jgi:histidinol phosphatase-like PHP family hydrolase
MSSIDAHSTDQLDQIRFGIITARRGGATKKDVLNTVTVSTLHKRIAAKR